MSETRTYMISRDAYGRSLFLRVAGDGSMGLTRKAAAREGDAAIFLTAEDLRLIVQAAGQ